MESDKWEKQLKEREDCSINSDTTTKMQKIQGSLPSGLSRSYVNNLHIAMLNSRQVKDKTEYSHRHSLS